MHCISCYITDPTSPSAHYISHKSHYTLQIPQVTLHGGGHIGNQRKARAGRVLPGSPARKSNPAPPPLISTTRLTPNHPPSSFPLLEGWWGMLEAKHSANSWLFPGPRYHWPGFLLGQNRAWTIEFWAAGCSLFAYLACHADEATSLDMSLHHPAALECTLHHN